MKLHAFRDRKEDADKDLGRHHALDVYRLIAMLTEPEERLVREMMGRYRDTDAAKAAVQIVADDFRTQTSIGALRIREHSLAGENLQVDKAIELLNDLFGTPG